jgi:iron(III) transport system permease protein
MSDAVATPVGAPTSRAQLPAPTNRRVLGLSKESWICWAAFVVTVVLVLMPLVPTLVQALRSNALYEENGTFTLDNFRTLFTATSFPRVIWNTVLFAALTTVVALVTAVVLAVLLVRVNIPGADAMGNILLWPIYLSPLVLAFGFLIVYGPVGFVTGSIQRGLGLDGPPWNLYSIPGMAITEAVAMVPLAFLYCSTALRQADASLENAARTCGAGPLRILFQVILPMLRPPMFYAALLIFSTALESLSIPLLFGRPVGINTFSTFIYEEGREKSPPDYGLVGAASIFILAVVMVLVTVQTLALRNSQRFVAVRGKAQRPRQLDIGRWKWVGFAFVLVYLLVGPIIPIIGLIMRAFVYNLTPMLNPFTLLTTSNFDVVFQTPTFKDSIRNSVVIAVIGSVLMTLFVSVVVLIVRRSTFRFAKLLEFVAMAPQSIPGLILGVGFFWAFTVLPGGPWLAASVLALVIAFGVRGMPQAFGGIAPVVMQIGRELDSASRSLGADWWRTFTRILFKLLLPGMLAGFTLLFVQMMKEFTPAIFLSSTPVIGTTSLQLWLNGETGSVAALSIVQIAITAVFILFAARFLRVRRETSNDA